MLSPTNGINDRVGRTGTLVNGNGHRGIAPTPGQDPNERRRAALGKCSHLCKRHLQRPPSVYSSTCTYFQSIYFLFFYVYLFPILIYILFILLRVPISNLDLYIIISCVRLPKFSRIHLQIFEQLYNPFPNY